MDLVLQAAVIGLVQGLTEFIPVSSSAHLIVVPRAAWLERPVHQLGNAFDVMLHMGTLVALLIYFWTDCVRYLGASLGRIRERRIGEDPDRRLAWLIFISMVPGASSARSARASSTRSSASTACSSSLRSWSIGATILWLAEWRGSRRRGLEDLRVPDAVGHRRGPGAGPVPGDQPVGHHDLGGLFAA